MMINRQERFVVMHQHLAGDIHFLRRCNINDNYVSDLYIDNFLFDITKKINK